MLIKYKELKIWGLKGKNIYLVTLQNIYLSERINIYERNNWLQTFLIIKE